MKNRNLTLRFIATGLLLISFERGFSQDTLKCWSSKNKLRWNDFKGRVPAEEQQTSTKAVCPYGILSSPLRENEILRYKVRLVFYKNRAWTKDTSEIVLEHEQLHFDMAEIYARKMRKAIHDVLLKNKNPTSSDYGQVIKGGLEEDDKRQNAYDNETVHGLIRASQHKWEKQIRLELEQLKEYATTLEDCNWNHQF